MQHITPRLRAKPQKYRHVKIGLVIFVFLILSVFAFLFPNFSRATGTMLAKPLWFVRDTVGGTLHNVAGYVSSKKTLIAKNAELETVVASLQLKSADYGVLLVENQDLKTKLGVQGDSERILAKILSKPPYSPYDTFVIGAGSSEGIAVGSLVYLSDTIFVGTVSSLTGHTAVVTLFSNGGTKQQATLLRTGATLELLGKGGANFQVEVPKETDIVEGDTFLYPASGVSVIGNVSHIDESDQSSFKMVYIRIPGNIFSAQSLFVETLK